MIKKLLGALALSLTCTLAFAEGGAHIDRAPDRITNLASLQNGAKLFVNYCLNCHSASSMRYNKLTDLGLTEAEIKKNLLFTGDKVGDLMTIAMTPADAKKMVWLGTPRPLRDCPGQECQLWPLGCGLHLHLPAQFLP
jgi:ubiquinol-cytochrome c reductase cytochrome c1 subunit